MAKRRANLPSPTSHPTKSQIAARLVKRRLFPPEPAEGRSDGDQAEKLAKRHGTNRTYLFRAVKLRGKSREVFELVASGYLTVPQANAALALHKAKPAAFKTLLQGKLSPQEVRDLLQPFLAASRAAKRPKDPAREIKRLWQRCTSRQRITLRKLFGSNR